MGHIEYPQSPGLWTPKFGSGSLLSHSSRTQMKSFTIIHNFASIVKYMDITPWGVIITLILLNYSRSAEIENSHVSFSNEKKIAIVTN